MDPQFVQWIIGQAGVGGLAAFSLWMLNENNKRHVRDVSDITQRAIKEVTDISLRAVEFEKRAREDTERLYRETRDALQQNTKSFHDMNITLREIFIQETNDRTR